MYIWSLELRLLPFQNDASNPHIICIICYMAHTLIAWTHLTSSEQRIHRLSNQSQSQSQKALVGFSIWLTLFEEWWYICVCDKEENHKVKICIRMVNARPRINGLDWRPIAIAGIGRTYFERYFELVWWLDWIISKWLNFKSVKRSGLDFGFWE